MLNLNLGDMLALATKQDDESQIHAALFNAGFTKIYCSHTGLVIGAFTSDEMRCFIDLQMSLNPLADKDELYDICALAMIPASSRPSPLFQNMTPAHYRQLAVSFPEHLFRFLAGKLIFERWTHVSGHVNHGGKVEWLKSISIPENLKEVLDSLIRIDAVFGVRRCFIDHEMKARMESIRNEWPGFDTFANFVFDLEKANITRLADRNVEMDGKQTGNKMAQFAAIQGAAEVNTEEYMRIYNEHRKTEALREAAAESKAKEAMLRINRAFDSQKTYGETKISRGAEAVMSLAVAQADSQGALAEGFVLKALSTYDFTKTQARTLRNLSDGKHKVESSTKVKTPKAVKKAKIAFNIDLKL